MISGPQPEHVMKRERCPVRLSLAGVATAVLTAAGTAHSADAVGHRGAPRFVPTTVVPQRRTRLVRDTQNRRKGRLRWTLCSGPCEGSDRKWMQ